MRQSVAGMSQRHPLWSAAAAGVGLPAMRGLAADVPAMEGAPHKVTMAWMPTPL